MGNKSSSGIKLHDLSEEEGNISTGDLALLYRDDEKLHHYAVFVQHDHSDSLFPLLLIKGKTKPLPLDKYDPALPRHAHAVTATSRIYYGDYCKVSIRRLKLNREISFEEAFKAMDSIEGIPFSPEEVELYKDTSLSPKERSAIMCSMMVVHLYRALGVLEQVPRPTRDLPLVLEGQLPLEEPMYLKVPPVEWGKVDSKDPPPLIKLVDSLISTPSLDKQYLYTDLAPELQTGDLILLAGAESGGALIKFFDGAQFSHSAIIIRSKCTSELFLYEATPNHHNAVDVRTGKVLHGVQVVPFRYKVFSGWYSRVAVRRLVGITDEEREDIYQKLLLFRKQMEGKPYEKNYLELVLAAFNIDQDWLQSLPDYDNLNSLFCSEMVAAAYQKMGVLDDKASPSDFTPNDFSSVRQLKLLKGEFLKEKFFDLTKPPYMG